MSDPKQFPDGSGYFFSECTDIWIEGPGDSTVRPIPPERMEQAKAARELIYGSREPGPKPPPQDAK